MSGCKSRKCAEFGRSVTKDSELLAASTRRARLMHPSHLVVTLSDKLLQHTMEGYKNNCNMASGLALTCTDVTCHIESNQISPPIFTEPALCSKVTGIIRI